MWEWDAGQQTRKFYEFPRLVADKLSNTTQCRISSAPGDLTCPARWIPRARAQRCPTRWTPLKQRNQRREKAQAHLETHRTSSLAGKPPDAVEVGAVRGRIL